MIGNSIYFENGIYQDTFIASTGCDSIVTTNVFILNEITVEINATMLPTGYSTADGEATADAAGGAGGFIYTWSTGEVAQDISNVSGGTEYCVTVVDGNGCSASICKTILYDFNIAFANADSLDCNGGNDGVIDLTVQNGLGDYLYFWEDTLTGQGFNGIIMGNSGSAQITGLSSGTYSITVSDTYVSTEILLTIEEPTPLFAQVVFPTSNLCFNDCNASIDVETSGGNGPYTYAWSGGLDPVSNPTNICAGDYWLTITDDNGCTLELLQQFTQGLEIISSITEEISIDCGGDSNGVLSAIGSGGFGLGFNYLWSNGDNDSLTNNLSTGTYTVTIFDALGCTTTNSYFLSEPTPVTFDVVTEDVNCWNGLNSGSIAVENVSGGTAPYLFSFASEDFTSIPNFTQIVAGSYQVNVQDANGCSESTNAIINFPDPLNLTIGEDRLINLGETVTLDVIHSSSTGLITWELDSCQNCPTLELQPLESTMYEVTVLDTITGCSETVDVWVNVSKDRRVFIPNAFSPNEDGNNDLFMVFGAQESIVNINSLQVFDRWGATLFQAKDLIANNITEGWDGNFNGQRVSPGVYIYFVEIEFIDGRTEIFKGDVTLLR